MNNLIPKLIVMISTMVLFASVKASDIEVKYVDGFTVVCKTAQDARAYGDFPIDNPLQFQYTTQDRASCRITLNETGAQTGAAKVAFLTYEQRILDKNNPKKPAFRTPSDFGVSGDWEFFYVTRKNGQTLYAFVDDSNNPNLKSFLDKIKKYSNAITNQERDTLQNSKKAPASFNTLKGFGATMSK